MKNYKKLLLCFISLVFAINILNLNVANATPFDEIGIENYELHGKKLEQLAKDYLKKDGITFGKKIGCGYNGMVYCGVDRNGNKLAIKLSSCCTSTLNLNRFIPFRYRTPYMFTTYQYDYLGELELARRYVDVETYNEYKFDENNNVKKYGPIYLGENLPKIHAVYKWFDLDYYGSNDWNVVIVMDYIDGKTLNEYISYNTYSDDDVLSWAVKILKALQPLHKKGWKHRDLGLSNIIINPNGLIYIIDLGKAIDWYYNDPNTLPPSYPISYICNHSVDPDYAQMCTLLNYLQSGKQGTYVSNNPELKKQIKSAINKSTNCNELYQNLTLLCK